MQSPILASHHQSRTCSGINIPRLVLMTDDNRLTDPSNIIPFLPPRSAVIVRSRSQATREKCALDITELCQQYSVTLLVSYETPPSQLIGDGVHVPESARENWLRKDFWRLRPELVTTSAHNLSAASKAASWGADAVLLSPICPTYSHDDRKTLGYWRGAMISQRIRTHAIALGGIDHQNIRRAFSLGFAGCAGIGLFVP